MALLSDFTYLTQSWTESCKRGAGGGTVRIIKSGSNFWICHVNWLFSYLHFTLSFVVFLLLEKPRPTVTQNIIRIIEFSHWRTRRDHNWEGSWFKNYSFIFPLRGLNDQYNLLRIVVSLPKSQLAVSSKEGNSFLFACILSGSYRYLFECFLCLLLLSCQTRSLASNFPMNILITICPLFQMVLGWREISRHVKKYHNEQPRWHRGNYYDERKCPYAFLDKIFRKASVSFKCSFSAK